MSDPSGSRALADAGPSAGAASVTPENAWARFGWLMGAVWLVFLIYPALALLQTDATAPRTALGWVGLGAFAIAYLVGFIVGMRVALPRISGVAFALFGVAVASAALTIPALGWGVTSFTPFLMSYSSYLLSRRWHWAVNILGPLVILVEIITAASRSTVAPWPLLWMSLLVGTVNSINSWLLHRSARADALRFELATSEEREGVARDVHDLIGHSLTVIKLKAELAAKTLNRDPDAARGELDEIVRIATESIASVRTTVSDLRLKGLAEQLEASRSALSSAGIRLEVHGSPTALSPAQSVPAAWVLREATTNVLRHANASRVRIEFAPGTMSVSDSPASSASRATQTIKTFETRRTPGLPHEPLHEGNGIRGMRERAAEAGAELTLSHSADAGVSVRMTW